MLWIIFALAATAVLFSGRRLTLVGDEIAEITGLSRGFIGVILLGFVTSLPELASTIGAAVFCRAPDLALGNVFGSNAANLAILAFLDLIFSTPEKNHGLDAENRLTAYLALIIASLSLMALAANGSWHLWHLDLFSLLIGLTYIGGLKLLHNFQKNDAPPAAAKAEKRLPNHLRKALLLHTIIIVAAAMVLAACAEKIAVATGWGTTFVGNSLLAFATSLPEIVVTLSAIRLGSFAMAAGNIFGSNIFNIGILAVTDLLFWPDSLFGVSAASQGLIAAIGLLLVAIYLFAGDYQKVQKIQPRRPPGAIIVLAVYLFSLYALFALR